jgi:hypothetical protein
MQCVYIYTYIHLYICIYIYTYNLLYFTLFWLSWTAVQRETQVRGIHEQCRMEKKTYIYIFTLHDYVYIYIHIICMR